MRPKSDKKMFSIRLSEALIRKVKETARKEGITVTMLVDKALRADVEGKC